MIFYIQAPSADSSTIFCNASASAGLNIGWPKTAISAMLTPVCNSGTWVEVNFLWLGIELAVLAAIAYLCVRLVLRARKKPAQA